MPRTPPAGRLTCGRPGGTITIAGKPVSRVGLGTNRLTGPGIWGDPPDLAAARRVLRDAVFEYGITHLDTADAYGPHSCELVIRQALHPYPPHLLIASKVGMIRPGPDVWCPLGRPDYLRAAVEMSLRRLRVDRLDLCYLHRVDPSIPIVDQVGALAELAAEGKLAAIGLSEVSVDQIATARLVAPIAAVQNRLNLDEPDDPALEYCAKTNIPYVAYRPLNSGRLNAKAALAFLLELGPHIAPIPGTSDPDHLRELITAVKAHTENGESEWSRPRRRP